MYICSTSQVTILGGCGEPAISLHSHHVSLVQWTTSLLPVTRDPGSNPLGVLMLNRDFPVSIVSLDWWSRCHWSFLWPRLKGALSRTITRPSCHIVIIPLVLTQLSCPGFTLTGGLPSGFTTDGVGCWGGGLWRVGGTYVKPGFSC
jgi:hypothetical protein